MFNLLDLFSGIGGFSLGLERSGAFKTVAFCEIEPYCQKVLAKHWPKVPIYDDVRTITAERLTADGITVDAICGGFPCQDISFAGKGAGLEGERSGLWFEYARIIGELRPRYVIVENVSALLSRGLDRVLGTLASLGYDAEWHCIPASAIGAPHRRDRMWIVGYPCSNNGRMCDGRDLDGKILVEKERQKITNNIKRTGEDDTEKLSGTNCGDSCENVYDAYQLGTQVPATGRYPGQQVLRGTSETWRTTVGSFWAAEPDVGRVANGVPARSHRLRALGNAVVPQIPELIGRAIAAREEIISV